MYLSYELRGCVAYPFVRSILHIVLHWYAKAESAIGENNLNWRYTLFICINTTYLRFLKVYQGMYSNWIIRHILRP